MKYHPSINKTIYASSRSATRARSICADYASYEAYKAEWRASNPDATAQQYEVAIRAIAQECGI